jgi:hypothetical protein
MTGFRARLTAEFPGADARKVGAEKWIEKSATIISQWDPTIGRQCL